MIIAMVLGFSNLIFTLQLYNGLTNLYNNHYYSGSGFGGISTLTFFISFIFLLVYPFHALSIDYKNNVMALMIASGVNRTKLYFAKIGATMIASFLLMLIIIVIPVFVASLFYGEVSRIGSMLDRLISIDYWLGDVDGISPFLHLLSSIISYASVIVIIYTATIFTKGTSKTVLIFLGLIIVANIIMSTFLTPILQLDAYYDPTLAFMCDLVGNIFKIVVFGFLSLRQLNIQSL